MSILVSFASFNSVEAHTSWSAWFHIVGSCILYTVMIREFTLWAFCELHIMRLQRFTTWNLQKGSHGGIYRVPHYEPFQIPLCGIHRIPHHNTWRSLQWRICRNAQWMIFRNAQWNLQWRIFRNALSPKELTPYSISIGIPFAFP